MGQRGTVTRLGFGQNAVLILESFDNSSLKFEYAYIFGAVCPDKDRAVGLVLPTIGMVCMQKHLDEIAKEVAPGNHAVVVFDRAAWHTTKKLRLPGNISLLPLPAASPELNPTEQVWQTLRDRYLVNRCFDSYEHILDSCCDAWNAFCSTVGAVRQLCIRELAITKSYFLEMVLIRA